ncbi:TerB family tellurite resistance protein [uncultured Rhodospira sp.]|uniref:TerB family tellurite resistance protein n=1 Tax=uncultured Rhodospira sp. TaxID=1936189 RepID=UPI002621FCF6|nr:TerB family tellurite resistance protein [uncultured Rhodospira sp.]
MPRWKHHGGDSCHPNHGRGGPWGRGPMRGGPMRGDGSDRGIWGKLAGGGVGMMLGGPLGALIGVAAGHQVDRAGGLAPVWARVRAALARVLGPLFGAPDDPTDGATETAETARRRFEEGVATKTFGTDPRQQAFAVGVIVLGAKMAKADGRVTRDEVAAFKRIFHIPPEDMAAVGAIFDEAKRSADGYAPYASQIADLFADSPQVLEELLGALYHIARADGVVHPEELRILHDVARLFGLPADAVNRLRAQFERAPSESEPDPYQVLGVAPDASDDAVRAAWRRLSREHHPDALMAKGMPREFVAQATETMATINHAYDRIRERRGLR